MSADEWHVYLKDQWVGPLSISQVTLALRQVALGPSPRIRCGDRELPLGEAVARLTAGKAARSAALDSSERTGLAAIGVDVMPRSEPSWNSPDAVLEGDACDSNFKVPLNKPFAGRSTLILAVVAETAATNSATPTAAEERSSASGPQRAFGTAWRLWVAAVVAIALIATAVVWLW